MWNEVTRTLDPPTWPPPFTISDTVHDCFSQQPKDLNKQWKKRYWEVLQLTHTADKDTHTHCRHRRTHNKHRHTDTQSTHLFLQSFNVSNWEKEGGTKGGEEGAGEGRQAGLQKRELRVSTQGRCTYVVHTQRGSPVRLSKPHTNFLLQRHPSTNKHTAQHAEWHREGIHKGWHAYSDIYIRCDMNIVSHWYMEWHPYSDKMTYRGTCIEWHTLKHADWRVHTLTASNSSFPMSWSCLMENKMCNITVPSVCRSSMLEVAMVISLHVHIDTTLKRGVQSRSDFSLQNKSHILLHWPHSAS